MSFTLNNARKNKLAATLLVTPAFLLHLVVVAIPSSTLLYYSFTNWSGVGRASYCGLDNFVRFLHDTDFLMALVRNVIYMAIFLTAPVITGLSMALLVNGLKGSQKFFRTLFFLPFVVSSVVAGKVFSFFYSPYIGIGRILTAITKDTVNLFAPFGNPRLALFAVAFIDYWHWWAFVMVLFISALSQVDIDLYESAKLEGANRVQVFWNITVPQILSTILTIYMFTMIAAFLVFDWIYVTTKGGPAGSTHVAATWIYEISFRRFQAGYGSALSLIVCLICLFVYFAFTRLQKRRFGIL